MTKFNRGAFVELTHAPYDTWGVGKILAVEGGGGILVEYFDSPGNPKAQVARVEDWQLKPFRVPPRLGSIDSLAHGGRSGGCWRTRGRRCSSSFPIARR